MSSMRKAEADTEQGESSWRWDAVRENRSGRAVVGAKESGHRSLYPVSMPEGMHISTSLDIIGTGSGAYA